MNQKSFEFLTENQDQCEYDLTNLPDWKLIDEISITLLEQGIGTFETLQKALPSVVFANIDSITDKTDKSDKLDNEDENINNNIDNNEITFNYQCSLKRFKKLFRIAQLQLNYVLRTQHNLLDLLNLERLKCEKIYAENKTFRRTMLKQKDDIKSPTNSAIHTKLFKCNGCSKIFLNSTFLYEHIQRKHRQSNVDDNDDNVDNYSYNNIYSTNHSDKQNKRHLNAKENCDQCNKIHCCANSLQYKICDCCKFNNNNNNNDNSFNLINQQKYQKNNEKSYSLSERCLIKTNNQTSSPNLSSQKSSLKSSSLSLTSVWE